MKYLSRNKVYTKIEVLKEAKKIYIFCEGQTEINYFKYFKGFSSNIDIIPIPNKNGQSDPVKLKEHAELLFLGNEKINPRYKLSKEYKDEVWFVIDTDRWNEGNKIEQLSTFCKQQSSKANPWTVVQSNPCFELWLYFHFNNVKPIENEVAAFKSFKTFVNEKISGGFDSRSMPIEIESAIANSSKYFELENNQPKLFSTSVFNLGKTILPFVSEQLSKAKNMMTKKAQ